MIVIDDDQIIHISNLIQDEFQFDERKFLCQRKKSIFARTENLANEIRIANH